MVSLSFSRAITRAKYAPLLNLLIEEGDPRYDDHMIVMGAELGAEAYASQEARDAGLGPASEHFEYIPVSAQDVAAAEHPLGRMAIGPGLNDAGFAEVASSVLAAAIADEDMDMGNLNLDVVIARTEYMVRSAGPSGMLEVHWLPLFNPYVPRDDWKLESATASWLQGFIAGHFAKLDG